MSGTPIHDQVRDEWAGVRKSTETRIRIELCDEFVKALLGIPRPNAAIRNLIDYYEQQLAAAVRNG
jgi:hypothetical protein